jgi:F-type H+-transporting ATPase subunit epsilon
MSAAFQFDLVSPESILMSHPVTQVVIPGSKGDFGVLADHAPLLSSIRSGVIRVTYENGEKHMVFVSGGFADVNGSLCTVLAEEAVNLDDLDAEELKAVIGELEANHKENIGMEEEHYIRRQLEIMLAKLDAVKTYKF